MAMYAWKGLQSGQYASGRIEGINRDEAAFKVKEQKIIITSLVRISGIEEESTPPDRHSFFSRSRRKVPVTELVALTKKLEAMTRAGLPILETIDLISTQIDHKETRRIAEQIKNDVESGTPLSESFGKHPQNFDNIYINLVKAGETSGKLDIFLKKLTEGMEKNQEINSRIKKAMIYPIILLIVAIIVIAVMMIFVVPVFQNMFQGMASGLPAATRTVIAISEFVRDPVRGGVLFGGLIGVVLILRLLNKNSYQCRRVFHRVMLKTPLLGELVQQSALTKLAMVQGNLSAAGVPVLEALDICVDSMTNLVIRETMTDVKRGVFSGEPLSALYEKTPRIFPPTFFSMVSVGERTGNMEEMFQSISSYYQGELETTIDRLTALLEPTMIVFMGTTIGFILVAMYTPIFQVGQTL